ncbi:MAG: dienelactone hydrolase family protein, partial [Bacteroidota bacterium]|nr:dienelactone hydrolase family protein [Bacteroidota bacterium]
MNQLANNELYLGMYDLINRYVRELTTNPEQVAEITQEVLVKMHRSLHTLQDPGKLAAWLRRVVCTNLGDYHRQHHKLGPLTGLAPAAEMPEHPAGNAPVQDCLLLLLRVLPLEQRELLEAVALAGISQAECARQQQPAPEHREGAGAAGQAKAAGRPASGHYPGGRAHPHVLRLRAGELAGARPLLLALHGSNLDGATMRRWTGYEFDQLADRHGFAVLYPDDYQGNWNDCRRDAPFPAKTENIDDMSLLRALVAHFQAAHRTDAGRVYAFGYSNGGQMALRLAMEAPRLVAAIATADANLPTPASLSCASEGPTAPVLLVAGTADPISST